MLTFWTASIFCGCKGTDYLGDTQVFVLFFNNKGAVFSFYCPFCANISYFLPFLLILSMANMRQPTILSSRRRDMAPEP